MVSMGKMSELRFKLSPSSKGVLLMVEQGDFSTFPQAEKLMPSVLAGGTMLKINLESPVFLYNNF